MTDAEIGLAEPAKRGFSDEEIGLPKTGLSDEDIGLSPASNSAPPATPVLAGQPSRLSRDYRAAADDSFGAHQALDSDTHAMGAWEGINQPMFEGQPPIEEVERVAKSGTPLEKKAMGVRLGADKFLSGLTSPLGIATLGLSQYPALGKALAVGFGVPMLKEAAIDLPKAIGEEMGKPENERDLTKLYSLWTAEATSAGMGAGLMGSLAHPMSPKAEVTPQTAADIKASIEGNRLKPQQPVTPQSDVQTQPKPQMAVGTEPAAGEYRVTDLGKSKSETQAQAEIDAAWPDMTEVERDNALHGHGLPKRFGGRVADVADAPRVEPEPVPEPPAPAPKAPVIVSNPELHAHVQQDDEQKPLAGSQATEPVITQSGDQRLAEPASSKVVSAAIRDTDTGEVWAGEPLHGLLHDKIPNRKGRNLEAGFMDSDGKFLTQEQTLAKTGMSSGEELFTMTPEERADWKAVQEQQKAMREGKPLDTLIEATERSNPVRESAKEFDKLVLDYAIPAGWARNVDALYQGITAKSGLGTMGVKAKILQNQEMAKARRQAAKDLGIDPDTIGQPRVRAEALAKLKQHVAGRFPNPDVQDAAFQKSQNAPAKLKLPASQLKVGDTLNIKGESVKVTDVDPDTFDVTLEDGSKFGTQTLKDGATVLADEWHSESKGDFELANPESVEEQKTRRAREDEEAVAIQKQHEQETRRATAEREERARATTPLGGDLGSAGQGKLFSEPGQQEMFSKTAEKPQPPAPATKGKIVSMGGLAPSDPLETVGKTGNAEGGYGGDVYGVAERVRDKRANAGQVEEVKPGKGISAPDSVDRGRQLLSEGVDPEQSLQQFEQSKRLSSDDMAVVRAKGEQLAKAARSIEERFGTDSDEYRMAFDALSKWDTRSKAMQTEWHKTGQAQQGETDIDTGTFTGLAREYKARSGKDFTEPQAETAKRIAKENSKAGNELDSAKKKLYNDPNASEAKPVNAKQAQEALSGHEKGKPFTPKEVKALWGAAKSYIEKGEDDFDTIRNKLATDLGLPVDEVTRGLSQNQSTRRLANDVWLKQQQARRLKQVAIRWLTQTQMPMYQRAIQSIPRIMFALKVGFHGTVALGTHAPMVAFQPPFWANYARNFVKMYKMVGSPAFYEMEVQNLLRRPNYGEARRAGLVNDPHSYEDFNNPNLAEYLGRLSGMGNRGYSVLKLLRQDMFDQHWNKLPKSTQTPEVAKAIADGVNHATGVVKSKGIPGSNIALFAPRLEASRVAWLTVDPIKAADTFARWNKAAPAEKMFAVNQVKEKAWVAGTMFGMLALNQGILSLTQSDQKVNFTDPMKGDFLKFKVAGMNASYGNAMVTMARLPIRMWAIRQSEGGKLKHVVYPDESTYATIGEYLRSQESPFAGLMTDLWFRSDWMRRPLPNSNRPMPKRLAVQGVKPYTWPEFWSDKALPIPFAEAAKEVWKTGLGMNDDQVRQMFKALATISIMSATGGRLSDDYELPHKQKH